MNQKSLHTFLKAWLDRVLGKPLIFTITFDTDFVAGNLVDGVIGASTLAQVPFDTDHDTTLQKLAEEIQTTAEIFKATVTGARELTCVGAVNGSDITPRTITVSGGATQAVATFADTQTPVFVISYLEQQNKGTKGAVGQTGKFYPYATYDLLSDQQVGHYQDEGPADDQGLWNYGGWHRVPIRIQYFGKYALEELGRARQSLVRPSIRYLFQANDIAVHEKGSVQNISTMLETIWEERAAWDLALGITDTVQDDVGLIERIKVTGTMAGGQEDATVGPFIVEAND